MADEKTTEKTPQRPAQPRPSREASRQRGDQAEGVQHIRDDVDAPMDTSEEYPPEGREEVVVAGDAPMSEEAQAVVEQLSREGVKRPVLMALRTALDSLLLGKGQVPEPSRAEPLVIRAGELAVNQEATEGLDHEKAAKLAGVKTGELLSFNVRQQRMPGEKFVGPAYLRFVRTDGTKDAVEIEK